MRIDHLANHLDCLPNGLALGKRAMEECARLGVGQLFLFTPTIESLYARLGWVACDRTQIQGNPVVVMKRAIESGPAR